MTFKYLGFIILIRLSVNWNSVYHNTIYNVNGMFEIGRELSFMRLDDFSIASARKFIKEFKDFRGSL